MNEAKVLAILCLLQVFWLELKGVGAVTMEIGGVFFVVVFCFAAKGQALYSADYCQNQ